MKKNVKCLKQIIGTVVIVSLVFTSCATPENENVVSQLTEKSTQSNVTTSDLAETVTSQSMYIVQDEDDDDEADYDEYDVYKIETEEAVAMSYSIVSARCKGVLRDETNKTVYKFSLLKAVDGCEMPTDFSVTVYKGEYCVDGEYSYSTVNDQYAENSDYLLMLEKRISVFYSEDEYCPTAGFSAKLYSDDVFSDASIQGRPLEKNINNVSSLMEYLSANNLKCSQAQSDIGIPFTTSDDMAEVVKFSDYILEVEISDVAYANADDRTTYDCKIISTLKSPSKSVSKVYAALPKDSAKKGEKYILLLNRCSDTSYVFAVSSLSFGIFQADSAEADEIRKLTGDNR